MADHRNDWAANVGGFAIAWGIPIAALLVAIGLSHPAKTWIWAVSLVWMGMACMANAVRCGRLHCYFAGPFFLLMAVAPLVHGYRIVWLGAEGWRWLGIAVGAGGGVLWCLPEHLWGKYREMKTENGP